MVKQQQLLSLEICLKSRLTGRLSGNIGYVASKVAQETSPDEYLITELSSFQLLGIEHYKPHIAIITNIYSAHLDYHESLENYQNAKRRIYKNQTEDDYLICNYHQRHLIETENLKAKTLYFSTQQEVMASILKIIISFIMMLTLLILMI